MLSSAGANPLALRTARKKPSDDRPPCLENPRPGGAELTLTENAPPPFQAEPKQPRLPSDVPSRRTRWDSYISLPVSTGFFVLVMRHLPIIVISDPKAFRNVSRSRCSLSSEIVWCFNHRFIPGAFEFLFPPLAHSGTSVCCCPLNAVSQLLRGPKSRQRPPSSLPLNRDIQLLTPPRPSTSVNLQSPASLTGGIVASSSSFLSTAHLD
jgi:hypothetical protein